MRQAKTGTIRTSEAEATISCGFPSAYDSRVSFHWKKSGCFFFFKFPTAQLNKMRKSGLPYGQVKAHDRLRMALQSSQTFSRKAVEPEPFNGFQRHKLTDLSRNLEPLQPESLVSGTGAKPKCKKSSWKKLREMLRFRRSKCFSLTLRLN